MEIKKINKMENLLFDDSELFVKERPKKIPELQKNIIWNRLAEEVVENQWSGNDVSDIVDDLKDLPESGFGYERAKKLESFTSKATYFIDSSFIEWLDCLYDKFDEAMHEIERMWVRAHKIKPKFKKGDCLVIKKSIGFVHELKEGKIVFVNGFLMDRGKYLIGNSANDKMNLVRNYEDIEENSKVIKENERLQYIKKTVPLSCRIDVSNKAAFVDFISELGFREDKMWTEEEKFLLKKILDFASKHTGTIMEDIKSWQADGSPE